MVSPCVISHVGPQAPREEETAAQRPLPQRCTAASEARPPHFQSRTLSAHQINTPDARSPLGIALWSPLPSGKGPGSTFLLLQ